MSYASVDEQPYAVEPYTAISPFVVDSCRSFMSKTCVVLAISHAIFLGWVPFRVYETATPAVIIANIGVLVGWTFAGCTINGCSAACTHSSKIRRFMCTFSLALCLTMILVLPIVAFADLCHKGECFHRDPLSVVCAMYFCALFALPMAIVVYALCVLFRNR